MVMNLLGQLGAPILIELALNTLGLFSLLLRRSIWSHPNVRRILEPNRVVRVLDELTTHSQYLALVQLGDIVADLVHLLKAVSLLIVADQVFVLTECCVVVGDWA